MENSDFRHIGTYLVVPTSDVYFLWDPISYSVPIFRPSTPNQRTNTNENKREVTDTIGYVPNCIFASFMVLARRSAPSENLIALRYFSASRF